MLNSELTQMLEQSTDSSNPGCGTLCREHMSTINELVPTTQTVMPKAKLMSEIEANWLKYSNLKMNAFCSEKVYSNYHSLRGLVEEIPNNDECVDLKPDYLDQYGSNLIEKLRRKTSIPSELDFITHGNFLASLGEVRGNLNQIVSDISVFSEDFENINYKEIEAYPRSLDDMGKVLKTRIKDWALKDPAKMSLRAELFESIQDKSILNGKLVSQTDGSSKTLTLDSDLTQDLVVNRQIDQIQPFLEIVSSKQNLLLLKFSEVTDSEKEIQFEPIDIQNGKVGEIEQTLRDAFILVPSKANTIFASILGIAFDLLPVIFAFVAFHGYVRPEEEYSPVIG